MSTECQEISKKLKNMEIKREEIEYKMYNKETKETIDKMAEMIGSELSEPYSVFTYYYFLEKWPQLCYIAYHNNNIVGLILGKLEPHSNNSSVSGSTNRGYIAMIVVSQDYRRLGIAKKLVQLYIQQIQIYNGDEIVLETEADNFASLALYEHLGFFRDKKLMNYYMNGKDAYRLKMVLKLEQENDEQEK